MENKKFDKYLEQIVFSLKEPGSYSSADKIYRVVKNKGKHKISKNYIKKWLSKYKAFTQNKKTRYKFKRIPMVIPKKRYLFDADTCSYVHLVKYNKGYKYIAVFIDAMTRLLLTEPMKTLTGKEMKTVMKKVFDKAIPERLRTDGGSEYSNKIVKEYLKEQDIRHIVTKNQTKAALAERVIKTIRGRFALYMSHNVTYNWVDHLDELTRSINETYHRSIGMTPNEAESTSDFILWKKQHKFNVNNKTGKKLTRRKRNPYKFVVDDRVRLRKLRGKFDRELDETYTAEIFTVVDRFLRSGIPLYRVKDEGNNLVEGTFYNEELVKVNESNINEELYKIEKILKTRKRKGTVEHYVKWEGYNNTFNTWINADGVEDVT